MIAMISETQGPSTTKRTEGRVGVERLASAIRGGLAGSSGRFRVGPLSVRPPVLGPGRSLERSPALTSALPGHGDDDDDDDGLVGWSHVPSFRCAARATPRARGPQGFHCSLTVTGGRHGLGDSAAGSIRTSSSSSSSRPGRDRDRDPGGARTHLARQGPARFALSRRGRGWWQCTCASERGEPTICLQL